jgi:hypothetical protein
MFCFTTGIAENAEVCYTFNKNPSGISVFSDEKPRGLPTRFAFLGITFANPFAVGSRIWQIHAG